MEIGGFSIPVSMILDSLVFWLKYNLITYYFWLHNIIRKSIITKQ